MITKRETARQRPERISVWSEILRDDKELVLSAVRYDCCALEHVSLRLRDDKEVVLTAVEGNGSVLKWASSRLRDDYDVVHAAVVSRGKNRGPHCFTPLEYASDRLRDNREIVEAAVSKIPYGGYAFSLASERLRSDKDIALQAFWRSSELKYLKFVSEKLFEDSGFVASFLQRISGRDIDLSYFMEHISTKFKCDRDIILLAVQKSGYALEYASTELRGEKEIVMVAVQNQGRALEYASADLRNDKDIVLAAIHNDAFSYSFASDELRDNEEVLLEAMSNTLSSSAWNPLKVASERLRDNKDVVLKAVKLWGMYGLDWASERLKKDENLLQIENGVHTGQR